MSRLPSSCSRLGRQERGCHEDHRPYPQGLGSPARGGPGGRRRRRLRRGAAHAAADRRHRAASTASRAGWRSSATRPACRTSTPRTRTTCSSPRDTCMPRTGCGSWSSTGGWRPGRLSEVLGKATLETDTYLRTLGLARTAQAEAAALDAETRVDPGGLLQGHQRLRGDPPGQPAARVPHPRLQAGALDAGRHPGLGQGDVA